MTFLILIIFIAYIYSTNKKIKDLQEENNKLKKLIKKIDENGLNIEEKQNEVGQRVLIHSEEKIVKKELSEEDKKRIIKQREKEERERKNTTILITGAILIVVAAIVFLMSTWYTIPNILKTSVLVLLIAVFFGGSKIAKEKFKLEKTSNTFFYIAMAYIPICLISIAVFSLFGEFLSINGEGKYIYLTVTGIITALIYYLVYKKNNSEIVFYGSILSQVFSVILFSLIFAESVELISINLLLYNILFITLTSNQKNKLIEKINYIYSFIPYISIVLIMCSFYKSTILIPINFSLLAINYCALEITENRRSHAYMFNIALTFLGIHIIWKNELNLSDSFRMMSTLIYLISVYVLENVLISDTKRSNLPVSSAVVTLIALQYMFIGLFEYEKIFLKPYVISLIQCIICFVSYVKSNENGKEITSILIPIYFIATGFTFLAYAEVSYQYYLALSLITFVVGELLQGAKVQEIRNKFFVISHVFIGITFFTVLVTSPLKIFDDVLYFVLILAIYSYSYLKTKKGMFKYFAYISGIIGVLSGCDFFKISNDFMCLIPAISLVALLNLENKFKKLKDSGSDLFFDLAKIIAYIYLNILSENIGTLFIIALTTYLIYYHYINKESSRKNIIPLIAAMPTIFDNSLEESLGISIMLLSTIGLTVFSAKNKKVNLYTIFAGIYLLFTLDYMNEKYIREILFVIWSLYNWYVMKKESEKDVFKIFVYAGVLSLYNLLAKELELDSFTVFNDLGYIIFAIGVIRNVLKKYIKNIDAVEGITFIFIYLFAITSYVNEYDGMLFGILILGIILFSYIKKYGTLFLTSIAAILLNVLLLTREFWFSIPWWVYLLLIGTVLISFAVRNEVSEKNEKIDLGETLKRIKDKIEK